MTVFNGTFFIDNFNGTAPPGINRYIFETGELQLGDIVNGNTGTDHLEFVGVQSLVSGVFAGVTDVEQIYLDNFDSYVELSNNLVTSTSDGSSYDLIVHCGDATNTIDARLLTSTTRNIWLDGGAGEDTFYGGSGDGSVLDGFAGDDTIYLGLGTEEVNGGSGNDQISGSIMEIDGDRIYGGSDFDTLLFDSAGTASFVAGADLEQILLWAGTNNLTIDLQAGNVDTLNTIFGSTGADTVNASADYALNDFLIYGQGGGDILTGGIGDDTLDGGGDVDSLSGGGGNDLLIGGAGDDLLSGGNGNDIYEDVGAGDLINELLTSGNDTIKTSLTNYTMQVNVEVLDYTGTAAVTFNGSSTNNTIEGSGFDDTLEGREGNDTLNGLGGLDTLRGEEGNDTLNGAGSIDSLLGGIGNDTLNGGNEDDVLDGGQDDDILNGGNHADDLFGGQNNDTLNGGGGVDELFGQQGDDKLRGDAGNDILDGGDDFDTADYSTSTVLVNVNLTLPTGQAMLSNGTDTLIDIEKVTGSSFDDSFIGNGEDNEFDGGAGFDIVDYSGETDGLLISYSSLDERINAFTYPLPNFGGIGDDSYLRVELIIAGSGDDLLYYLADARGEGGNDEFRANALANNMDGGVGVDTAIFGDVGQAFTVYTIVDLENQALNDGMADGDTLTSIENLTYNGTSSGFLGGNGEDNILVTEDDISLGSTLDGRGGDDTLISIGFNDNLIGGTGFDTVDYAASNAAVGVDLSGLTDGTGGTAEQDSFNSIEGVIGSAFDDTLTGSIENNRLDGGTGVDDMTGGAGDDTFVVDQTYDATAELANEGTDTVISSITHVLRANIENLVLSGTANLNGTGNGLNNAITGNGGVNTLNGLVGQDSMTGLGGEDRYYVDNANDVCVEALNGGIDITYATLSWTLNAEVEKLYLQGTAADGTGNALSNYIYGTNSANRIDGKGGADRLYGYLGNDTYVANSTGDLIYETSAAGGIDTVEASVNFTLSTNVENLTLTGSANMNGTGNSLANAIAGNSGNNYIYGREGNDTLTGNAGVDQFVFDRAIGPANVDTITDFNVADDFLRLDDAIFAALSTGYLVAAAFRTGASAADADDRIIYDSVTGGVFYDSDGTGAVAQIKFATLSGGLALTAGDVYVF
jgi:Ca2+-binding RTX toxin-like protein